MGNIQICAEYRSTASAMTLDDYNRVSSKHVINDLISAILIFQPILKSLGPFPYFKTDSYLKTGPL